MAPKKAAKTTATGNVADGAEASAVETGTVQAGDAKDAKVSLEARVDRLEKQNGKLYRLLHEHGIRHKVETTDGKSDKPLDIS